MGNFLAITGAAIAVALVITKMDCPFSVCRRARERYPNCKPLRCTLCALFWAVWGIGGALWLFPALMPFVVLLGTAGIGIALLAIPGLITFDR